MKLYGGGGQNVGGVLAQIHNLEPDKMEEEVERPELRVLLENLKVSHQLAKFQHDVARG